MNEKGIWGRPYAHAGGVHSLSGPALSEVSREVLARGHSFRFHARGTSMSPFIRNGDVITLSPFEVAHSSPGTVVAFINPATGQLVVHRIVAVIGNCYRIRGDNCEEEDGEFDHESIIGTVSNIERAGKPVRFGLGSERALIALLSRRQWLSPCITAVGTIISLVRRLS